MAMIGDSPRNMLDFIKRITTSEDFRFPRAVFFAVGCGASAFDLVVGVMINNAIFAGFGVFALLIGFVAYIQNL